MRIRCLLVVIALYVAGCGRESKQPEAVSTPAVTETVEIVPRNIELQSLAAERELIAIDDFQGHVLLLDFWATWSAPSRKATADLNELYMELQGQGLRIIGMTVDRGDTEEIASKAMELSLSYPVVQADEDIQGQFGGIRAIPTRVLLDRRGQEIARYEGAIPLSDLRMAIEQALSE